MCSGLENKTSYKILKMKAKYHGVGSETLIMDLSLKSWHSSLWNLFQTPNGIIYDWNK